MSKIKLGVVLLWTLVFVVCAQSDDLRITPRLGEAKITEIVKGIIGRLCYGIPSMGIPKMEPFKQQQPIDVKFNHSMAELSGTVSNIHVTGLSGLELINITNSLTLEFSFEIKIPKVTATADFKLKGSLGGLFPIDGDGSVDIKVYNTKLIASGRLSIIDDILQLANLEAQPSIGGLEANIVNLVPNKEVNDFINKVLNNLGPELLKDLWIDIGEDVLREIEQLSKTLIGNVDKHTIVQIIMGFTPAFKPDDPPADCPPVKF